VIVLDIFIVFDDHRVKRMAKDVHPEQGREHPVIDQQSLKLA